MDGKTFKYLNGPLLWAVLASLQVPALWAVLASGPLPLGRGPT